MKRGGDRGRPVLSPPPTGYSLNAWRVAVNLTSFLDPIYIPLVKNRFVLHVRYYDSGKYMQSFNYYIVKK